MPQSPVDRAVAAVAAVRALQAAGHGDEYFLYASPHETRAAVGRASVVTVVGDTVRCEDGRSASLARRTDDPFVEIGRLLRRPSLQSRTLYGYFGFDLCRSYVPRVRVTSHTAAELVVPRIEIVLSAAGVQVNGDGALRRLVLRSLKTPHSPQPKRPRRDVALGPAGAHAYRRRVAQVLESLSKRELEKAIVSRRVSLPGRLDVLGTWLDLVSAASAARWYAFRFGSSAGVGASPELLLQADGQGRVATNPLAGTRPRGETVQADAQLRRELLADAKELREHIMSVQLASAELRSVCAAGSVGVTELMDVRRFRRVQHLSSRVEGRLAPGASVWDALRAVFPGVTVSGIPKANAVRLIARLEPEPRGIYGGAAGWIDGLGRCDLALAIRSAFELEGRAFVQAGAGILAGSRPGAEYRETCAKMSTILDGLRLTEDPAAER